jgi:hypothetical protein
VLDGQTVRPSEGLLLVQWLDDRADDESPCLPDGDYEGCLAQVIAAGPKTSSKAGQVVILRPFTRGTKAPGGSCLVEQGQVCGTLVTS